MFTSTGIIEYSYNADYGYKLIVKVDQGLSDYYRSLVPKWFSLNKQKYPPHITVVRKEIPTNLSKWEDYEGEQIEFIYDNIIRFGKIYCWLNVYSQYLEDVRTELGLSNMSEYTCPPDHKKCFHCTIGNFKQISWPSTS